MSFRIVIAIGLANCMLLSIGIAVLSELLGLRARLIMLLGVAGSARSVLLNMKFPSVGIVLAVPVIVSPVAKWPLVVGVLQRQLVWIWSGSVLLVVRCVVGELKLSPRCLGRNLLIWKWNMRVGRVLDGLADSVSR